MAETMHLATKQPKYYNSCILRRSAQMTQYNWAWLG